MAKCVAAPHRCAMLSALPGFGGCQSLGKKLLGRILREVDIVVNSVPVAEAAPRGSECFLVPQFL
jgi:hypothetical protein